MWKMCWRGNRLPELNKNSSGKTVLVTSLPILMKCCRTSGIWGTDTKGNHAVWVQYALWFRKWAGKGWPSVSRANYEAVVKQFSSMACLAPRVDRAAAFSRRWLWTSPTLVTHCCFHRLSCHPAGSMEMWHVQKLETGHLPLGPLRKGRQSLIFKCLVGLTHMRTHLNGLMWQSGFPGNKMDKQKILVMINTPHFYNFQKYMSRCRGERGLFNNYKMFCVMKRNSKLNNCIYSQFLSFSNANK